MMGCHKHTLNMDSSIFHFLELGKSGRKEEEKKASSIFVDDGFNAWQIVLSLSLRPQIYIQRTLTLVVVHHYMVMEDLVLSVILWKNVNGRKCVLFCGKSVKGINVCYSLEK
jgi:hypothetical protein